MLGANKQVTGSCTLLQVDNLNILVDYGITQDNTKSYSEIYEINNKELPVDASDIDILLVTHVHADHQNLAPLLVARGFKGSIITTALTAELMDISLRDSAYILNREAETINKKRKNNKVLPLYLARHVDMTMGMVKGYDFNYPIKISEKVSVELLPSGHIAGAASIMITYCENDFSKKRVLFTGDTSGVLRDKAFTMKPNFEKLKPTAIICESTYGDRLHSKVNPQVELEKHIRETVYEGKKTLLIPTFAIGRSTEVLHMLKKIYEENSDFESIPIFLASPMACKAHNVIGSSDSFNFYDGKWLEERDLWYWDRVTYIDNFKDVQSKLANGHPKIILASSGMIQGGYSSYLSTIFLPNKGSKILFCGYQGKLTTGDKTLNGEQKTISIDGVQVKKRADIAFLGGMSSHADQDELVELLSQVEKKKVKKIIINHGDTESSRSLAKELEKNFNSEIIIPDYKQIIKM